MSRAIARTAVRTVRVSEAQLVLLAEFLSRGIGRRPVTRRGPRWSCLELLGELSRQHSDLIERPDARICPRSAQISKK